jgi:hypothetical protein
VARGGTTAQLARMSKRLFLVFALAVTACGDDAPLPPDDLLDPPPPGEGVQFRMNSEIGPGREEEHCQFFVVPEDLAVNIAVVRFRAGSHHVLMYETPYAEIPVQNDRGEPIDTSGVFDCTTGATDGWSVTRLVGGSQNAAGDSVVEFPPGIGMRVARGTVLLMNLHVVNGTDEIQYPEIAMNLHSIPDDELEIEGGMLFYYNIFIRVPALAPAEARMSCAVPEAISLVTATSHMHRRGVGYQATLVSPAGARSPLFETSSWEEVPVGQFQAEPIQVAAGSRIEYACQYQNLEPREVWQGPKSTDEMCTFAAAYYPAKVTGLPYCEGDLNDWIGSGTATCSQTLDRLAAIGPNDNTLQAVTAAVLDSAPAASPQVSALVRCVLSRPASECDAQITACRAN